MGKPRRLDSFKRRKASITPRLRILVVCEGEKTEPHYFEEMRISRKLSSVEVEVCGKQCGSAPILVVKYALGRIRDSKTSKTKAPFDQVWCVVDVEMPTPHTTLRQAYDMATSNGIQIVLTNPCFEYWYLLHFELTDSPMNSNQECLKKLKKYIQEYDKSSKKFLADLISLTDKAMQNAKTLANAKGWTGYLHDINPSTDVYRLVEELASATLGSNS